MTTLPDNRIEEIWNWLKQIPDPEIPVISIVDLGVVRNVALENERLVISITPTYSGCPALKAMEDSVKEMLTDRGIHDFVIKMVLFPAWTTDWLSEETRDKLRHYGIAPPEKSTDDHLRMMLSGKRSEVTCPFCKSRNTHLTSAFGSTACKALHFCDDCRQPFEEFKCH